MTNESNPVKRAAERLPGHWIKEEMEDGKGNYCGLGHLRMAYVEKYNLNGSLALHNNPEAITQFEATARLLSEVAGEQYADRMVERSLPEFYEFNDHPDTTEEEVVAVLEKAAVRFEEQV